MRLLLTKEEKKFIGASATKKMGKFKKCQVWVVCDLLSKGQTTVGEGVDFPGSTTLLFRVSQDLRERLGFHSFIKKFYSTGFYECPKNLQKNVMQKLFQLGFV